MTEQDTPAYADAVGEQLRNVRAQQGLSLQEVEQRSEGRLKASVVGAYERGERAVSVARLRVLADFYRVPITQLLPRSDAGSTPSAAAPTAGGLRLDLTRLGAMPAVERQIVERFLSSIQARRGDYNGKVLTIRGEDLETLAAILDLPAEELCERLLPASTAAAGTPVPGPNEPSDAMAWSAAWMPRG